MTSYKKLRKKINSCVRKATFTMKWTTISINFIQKHSPEMSNATFASNCVAKIIRISVQHKCRTCVLSNGPPGNRRWLHVWTLSWKISAIRGAYRLPPEITEKNFFRKQCRSGFQHSVGGSCYKFR